MKAYLILLEGCIVDRTSFDGIKDPAVFFDHDSALKIKDLYFPQVEYSLVEVEAKFELVK